MNIFYLLTFKLYIVQCTYFLNIKFTKKKLLYRKCHSLTSTIGNYNLHDASAGGATLPSVKTNLHVLAGVQRLPHPLAGLECILLSIFLILLNIHISLCHISHFMRFCLNTILVDEFQHNL